MQAHLREFACAGRCASRMLHWRAIIRPVPSRTVPRQNTKTITILLYKNDIRVRQPGIRAARFKQSPTPPPPPPPPPTSTPPPPPPTSTPPPTTAAPGCCCFCCTNTRLPRKCCHVVISRNNDFRARTEYAPQAQNLKLQNPNAFFLKTKYFLPSPSHLLCPSHPTSRAASYI